MFGRRISLFSLFGFKVGIDASWFLLAIFITWSLAEGLFPVYFKGLSQATYWVMGVAGAIGLFISIIFHEFCHSLVARRYGLPMKGITLFIFGGVAEMEDEPASPKVEFLMAIAGPASSVLLGAIFYVINFISSKIHYYVPVNGVLIYLVFLNIILAVFNLIPAFPLDGGRVLRSILWAIKGNLRWATKVASFLGESFGFLLMFVGILQFFAGYGLGGVWYFLIGLFLRSASGMSYKQLLVRNALEGEKVEQFMKTDFISVPAAASIDDLVSNYIYKYHFKMFPVAEGSEIIGCITTEQIKHIPRDAWNQQTVKSATKECSLENTISPTADAMQALTIMNRTGKGRLLVMDNGKLVGLITLKDMLKFLALKIDLEGE